MKGENRILEIVDFKWFISGIYDKKWRFIMDFKGVFSTDKLLHASFSFILTVVVTAIFTFQPERLVIGGVVALLIGIGKEIYDRAKYRPDWRDQLFDFGFDIIGIVCALLSLTALGI